jgi:hypothetical protein
MELNFAGELLVRENPRDGQNKFLGRSKDFLAVAIIMQSQQRRSCIRNSLSLSLAG